MAKKLDRYTIEIDGNSNRLNLAVAGAVQELGKVNRAANDSNGSVRSLSDAVGQASTNVAAFQGPLGGVSGRLSALSSLLGSTSAGAVGLGLSVTGVVTILGTAVSEFDMLELRGKKTEAMLKATGSAAGLTAEELDDMSRRLALNSLGSVEGMKDGINLLLTFKSVGRDVFEDVMVMAQDMSATTGMSLNSAVMQLGKALESPSQGINALKRSGVSFSQSQLDVIKVMEDTGRVADAQRMILETLENQLGGAGTAEATDTLAGSIDTLGQRYQEFLEIAADKSGAYEGVNRFFGFLADRVDAVNNYFDPADQERLNDLLERRLELQQELRDLHDGERTGLRSWLVGPESEILNLQREFSAIDDEIQEIEGRQEAAAEAKKKAAEARRQYLMKQEEERKEAARRKQEQRDAEELVKQQEKSAAWLSNMDMQYASEEDKIQLKLDRDLERIESMQLSEAEIRARGFETIGEVRSYYNDLAYEQAENQVERLEERYQRQRDQELARVEKEEQEKQRIREQYAANRLNMERQLQGNLITLGRALTSESKKGQMLMLAIETGIKAKQAITSGYEAGMKAAAARAALGPEAAAAANAEMIAMGYTNAAAIVANGVIQGAGSASGSSGSSLSAFDGSDPGTGLDTSQSDAAVTAIPDAAERRAGQDAVVIQGDVYTAGAVQAMDAESFQQFAMNNKSAIAEATEAELNEYGRSLVS